VIFFNHAPEADYQRFINKCQIEGFNILQEPQKEPFLTL